MTEVFIFVGSGGVGKTTMAAAFGVEQAKLGKKVLVLTIDPSQRLASVLGIAGKTEITEVPGQNYKGKLFASIIDHQKTFNEFVLRAAQNNPEAVHIFENKLFNQLSSKLSQSQDFTSLQKLYSCYESGEFDLIILDTPPFKHTLDFLNAPRKLSMIFDEGLTKWLRDPAASNVGIFSRILNQGTRQALKIFETLTGAEFIHQLSEFFSIVQKWQGKIRERTNNVQKLLMSRQTSFYLVSNFDHTKLIEAELFFKEIHKAGFNLKCLILNRCFPIGLQFDVDVPTKDSKYSPFLKKFPEMNKYFKLRQDDLNRFRTKHSNDLQMVQIPDFTDLDQGLSELERIGQLFDLK